jgi:transcriptional regulator with XRE-family HTH domain
MSQTPRFADRLRALRERAGITQQQLAARAGMHKLTVAKLEQGIREPAWATVQALGEAVGVSCEAFNAPADDEEQAVAPRKRGRPRKPAGGAAPEGGRRRRRE